MKRLLKNQQGFTLVELLVVIAIIVALAAAIIPNIARFAGSGEKAASDAELQTVQTAMDTAMAELGFTAVVDKSAAAVVDFSSAGTGELDNPPAKWLYPEYLREKTAGYGPYDWDDTGLVHTQWVAP